MIEYYKSLGNIQFTYKSRIPFICKIKDNKIYYYDSEAKHWTLSTHSTTQYLFEWFDPIQLTLLDRVMLGLPE